MRNRLKFSRLAALLAVWLTGCATDRPALEASPGHAKALKSVAIGQTMNQVYRAAGSPETRKIRQTANSVEERWGYVTDYDNDTLTTIVFTNRIVTGIENERWDGAHLPNAVLATENLDSPQEAAFKASNLAHLDSVVKPGMLTTAIFELTGKQADAATAVVENKVVKQTLTYNMSDGTKVRIWAEGNKIVRVNRE